MKKFKDNIDAVFIFLGGVMAIVFSTINSNIAIDKLSISIGLLGSLFIVAGYERYKQREETEKKIRKFSEDFEKLQSSYLQIPFYEVIEGRENITEESIKEINNVENNIRVTSFKREDIQGAQESPVEFYSALGLLIRRKKDKLVYECCFNEGNSLTERKRAFNQLELTEEELDRMVYYQFKKQSYLNLMIIDDNVVFIGFPRHTTDKHMQIALKIKAENNKAAKTFIQSLTRWYDNILKKDGNQVETKGLLKE